MSQKHVDVLIVGAGLSGIGTACHLSRECPDHSYAILERRSRIGGTWDLFRYPGIRSDSDMFTFGYNFRPWTDDKFLADGPAIRNYIVETAEEYNVMPNIHFNRKVTTANWSTEDAMWTLEAVDESTGEKETYTCNFLMSCSGYYNYDQGHRPDFPGEKQFEGQIIHPQHWPENLDYKGKKVVVIGSGATAVTLVPAMAGEAEHITMLQRSPTYVASVPDVDPMSRKLRKFLPEMAVYRIARARNIGLQRMIYKLSQEKPKMMRRFFLGQVRKQIGPDIDMKHFEPSYNPWDERLCAVPRGDLFKVLRKGQASIVTDHIDTFTKKGIRLKSGEELEADIIITATGLELQMLGGVEGTVDGQVVQPNDTLVYRGVMLRDVPNMAMVFGYTNSSWTLKADLAAEYVCRVLKYMQKVGAKQVTPRDHEGCDTDDNFLGLQSGYVQRASDRLPRQGKRDPWRVLNNYLHDLPSLRYGQLDDDELEFSQFDESKKQRKGLLATVLGA